MNFFYRTRVGTRVYAAGTAMLTSTKISGFRNYMRSQKQELHGSNTMQHPTVSLRLCFSTFLLQRNLP